MFHSPKRGVMPATFFSLLSHDNVCFIPLNGALCLQLPQAVKRQEIHVSFP